MLSPQLFVRRIPYRLRQKGLNSDAQSEAAPIWYVTRK
jgi:hypothetical protein